MRRDNKCYLRGRNIIEIAELFQDPVVFKSFITKLGELIENRNDPKGGISDEYLKSFASSQAYSHGVEPKLDKKLSMLIVDLVSTGE